MNIQLMMKLKGQLIAVESILDFYKDTIMPEVYMDINDRVMKALINDDEKEIHSIISDLEDMLD